jgi:phosphoglycerate-specific signal transduction histidine kinase
MLVLLQRAKLHLQAGSALSNNALRQAMDLPVESGFNTVDVLSAMAVSLDWLRDEAESMPPKNATRYKDAVEQIRQKLNWEFGDRSQGRGEPRGFNFDSIITTFEFFADELETRHEFVALDQEELQILEDRLTELTQLVSDANLDRHLRNLLLDGITAIRQSIRDLRKYGSAASFERLKDAFGRLTMADFATRSSNTGQGLLNQAWELFANVLPYAEAIGRLKCLPDLIDSCRSLRK